MDDHTEASISSCLARSSGGVVSTEMSLQERHDRQSVQHLPGGDVFLLRHDLAQAFEPLAELMQFPQALPRFLEVVLEDFQGLGTGQHVGDIRQAEPELLQGSDLLEAEDVPSPETAGDRRLSVAPAPAVRSPRSSAAFAPRSLFFWRILPPSGRILDSCRNLSLIVPVGSARLSETGNSQYRS